MDIKPANLNEIKYTKRGRYYRGNQKLLDKFIDSGEICCEVINPHTSLKNLQTSISRTAKSMGFDITLMIRKDHLYIVNNALLASVRENYSASNGKEAEQNG